MELTVAEQRAFVHTGGGGTGTQALVLVHGAGMDHTVWAPVVRHLSHRVCRCFAPDLPGHGRSEGPALTSIEAMGAWLGALCAQLGEEVVLVGHSMGSLAALAASRHLPLRGLGLLGSALSMPVNPRLLEAAGHDLSRAANMICTWGHCQHLGGDEAIGMWMSGMAHRVLEGSPAGVLASDLQACAAFDPTAYTQEIPALVVSGRFDMMTPHRAGRALLEAVAPHGRFVTTESGHMMVSEAPEAVRRALAEFATSCFEESA